MKIVITHEVETGQFGMESDGNDFATIALLEIAKHSLIKQGTAGGRGGFKVRRVDLIEP